MHLPPARFDSAQFQDLHAGETVHTGTTTITHLGNALHEVSVQIPQASLVLSLAKGGTVISTTLLGQELFDRDADYHDMSKTTRTKGNPNIFPVFNQMPAGVVLAGAAQALPNHGIARNMPWRAAVLPDLPGVLVLQCTASAATRVSYPYDFTYTQFLSLDAHSLTIGQHITSTGPFAVGFHPYFRVADKGDIEITGLAAGTSYWHLPNALSKAEKDAVIAQNRSQTHVPGKRGSLDFRAGEVNHHYDLGTAARQPVVLTDPGLKRQIHIERSDAYHALTVWCNADEERSVCIEPTTDRSGMLSAKASPWQGWVRYTVVQL